ncbi:MAG: chemotaxis protein, partial [Rhizorhabdus sp.]
MKIVELDQLRIRGIRLFVLGSCILAILLGIGAALNIVQGGWGLSAFALLVNLAPVRIALASRHDLAARLSIGMLAAVDPAMLLYALEGHAWQMDMHMWFFVALGALAFLCDWRPLLFATILIAIHHLVLDFAAPQWVFEGSGNFGRVMLHAAAVITECAVLCYITHRLRTLLVTQGLAQAASEGLARDAEAAMVEARIAQADAERALAAAAEADRRAAAERALREQGEQAAAIERGRSLLQVAEQFESSVHTVVASVASAATQLES